MLDLDVLVVLVANGYHSCSVIIRITVVRSGKDGDDYWVVIWAFPCVEFITFILNFVSSNQSKQFLSFEQRSDRLKSKLVAAVSFFIVNKLYLFWVLCFIAWVTPKYVTHGPDVVWFLKSIDFIKIADFVHIW